MKNSQIVLGIALVALGLTSCKDERKESAEKTVDSYAVYVDSLGNVASNEMKENWQDIEASYNIKMEQAQVALTDLKEEAKMKEKFEATKTKYEELKAKMVVEVEVVNPKQKIRNDLFGAGKIGDDMNFNWVNANNILGVYQQFVDTVQANKDSYSREDWDEIKLMYEALDSRKNTVEKEGLTSSDNGKIAGLKLKFAPMYTLNRMGAKSEEMKEAKK